MREYTALVLIVALKSIVAGLAVAGAIYLADAGKDGWGWMIFLALCLGAGGISMGSSRDESKSTKTKVSSPVQ